jgi:hypothetical protein
MVYTPTTVSPLNLTRCCYLALVVGTPTSDLGLAKLGAECCSNIVEGVQLLRSRIFETASNS